MKSKNNKTDKELEQKGLKRKLTSTQTLIVAVVVYLLQSLFGGLQSQSLVSSGLGTLGLILLIMSAVVRFQEIKNSGDGLIKSILLALIWFFGGMFLVIIIENSII